jgi:hypothetical protein
MAMGARFAKWGLGLFVFGIFLTFGIIAHYCVGASVDNGPQFMKNIFYGGRVRGHCRSRRCRPVALAWWRLASRS